MDDSSITSLLSKYHNQKTKKNGYYTERQYPSSAVIEIIRELDADTEKLKFLLADVIRLFSGENLMKLQSQFASLYGNDEIAKEAANSFSAGFGKACEMICNDLQNGL